MPNPSYFCAEASLHDWLLILALVSNQSNLCSIKGERDLDDLPGSSQASDITLLATDLWEPILKFRKQMSTFFPQIIWKETIMMPFWWGQCHQTPWGIINCPNTHYLCMCSSTVCQEKGAYKLTDETGIQWLNAQWLLQQWYLISDNVLDTDWINVVNFLLINKLQAVRENHRRK